MCTYSADLLTHLRGVRASVGDEHVQRRRRGNAVDAQPQPRLHANRGRKWDRPLRGIGE